MKQELSWGGDGTTTFQLLYELNVTVQRVQLSSFEYNIRFPEKNHRALNEKSNITSIHKIVSNDKKRIQHDVLV